MNQDKQVALLLSDEESIFNDYLYFYFRIYKKNLIKKLFSKALDRILEQEIEEISKVKSYHIKVHVNYQLGDRIVFPTKFPKPAGSSTSMLGQTPEKLAT